MKECGHTLMKKEFPPFDLQTSIQLDDPPQPFPYSLQQFLYRLQFKQP